MDGIITTCNAANQYLDKPADAIIPHGVDLQRFHCSLDKTKDWAELGFGGKYGIGIFGRVRASKGVDLFVKAALTLAPNTLMQCSLFVENVRIKT